MIEWNLEVEQKFFEGDNVQSISNNKDFNEDSWYLLKVYYVHCLKYFYVFTKLSEAETMIISVALRINLTYKDRLKICPRSLIHVC